MSPKKYPSTQIERQLTRFSIFLGVFFIVVGIVMKTLNLVSAGYQFITIEGLPFANQSSAGILDGTGTIILGIILLIFGLYFNLESNEK